MRSLPSEGLWQVRVRCVTARLDRASREAWTFAVYDPSSWTQSVSLTFTFAGYINPSAWFAARSGAYLAEIGPGRWDGHVFSETAGPFIHRYFYLHEHMRTESPWFYSTSESLSPPTVAIT